MLFFVDVYLSSRCQVRHVQNTAGSLETSQIVAGPAAETAGGSEAMKDVSDTSYELGIDGSAACSVSMACPSYDLERHSAAADVGHSTAVASAMYIKQRH